MPVAVLGPGRAADIGLEQNRPPQKSCSSFLLHLEKEKNKPLVLLLTEALNQLLLGNEKKINNNSAKKEKALINHGRSAAG